jgi:hypothetical protein
MYNKLFTKILDSSVWLEPTPTRIVWVTLLAAMDENGFCPFAAAGNVANRARVSVDEAKAAIQTLEDPDPDSSDPEHEGKRIERVPGGWMVLNAAKYRLTATRVQAQEKTKERVRRHRAKKRCGNGSETLRNSSETPSEAYTNTKKNICSTSGKPSEQVLDIYAAYPRRVAPKKAYAAITKALADLPFPKLLTAVQAFAQKVTIEGTEPKFIPHPATWFNGGRYMDEESEPAGQKAAHSMVFEPEKPVHEFQSRSIPLSDIRKGLGKGAVQ